MTRFPLELGTGTRGKKTRMLGLTDGRKSFKIDLAVYTQYRSVTDRHPASHVAVAKTALAERCMGKNIQIGRYKKNKTNIRVLFFVTMMYMLADDATNAHHYY